MTKKALILIDIQNDYFEGGALQLVNPTPAADTAKRLLAQARAEGDLIVHIQHVSLVDEQPFMKPGTPGIEIHSSVAPLSDEVVVQKHYPNSFWQTDLEAVLKEANITELTIAGMMTHMCVSTTARGAMERGYATTVVTDACATMDLPFNDELIPAETVHKTALAEVANLVQLKTAADLLA